MAFWNREKKRRQEEERLEHEAQERLDEIREKKKASHSAKADQEGSEDAKDTSLAEKYQTEIVKPVYKNDQKRYVTECCQAINEVEQQVLGTRKEYQHVTDALMDVQKIDRIKGEDRKALLEAGKSIVKLTKERNQYKNRNLTISDAAIRRLEPYEDELVDEIKKMYDAQAYQDAIDGDLDKLHGEKKKLRQEKKEIVAKQHALKGMAKILIVLIISLFILFLAIYYTVDTDMTLPYLGTVLLAAISATVIFFESNRNRREMAMTERKMDKAIGLLNRVKIKCVNNLNVLEYNKEKFGVKSALDFENVWNEYCKAKEYERKFRENTEQLNYYCDELLEILKEHQILDREIWIGQVLAIVDEREMVEIRHKLNSQRQKLRERIEYNEGVKAEFVKSIDELLKENPENKEDILAIVEIFNQNKDL